MSETLTRAGGEVSWDKKDLLDIKNLSAGEIKLVLDTAESFKEISERDIKKVPTLRGKTVITLFYEASTRTRVSFEIAGKRLSADTVNISTSTSSVQKGETLIDMARNLEAMAPDAIIMRHNVPGAPYILASRLESSIINAGDGAHEHPTQALLDAFTIREKKGRFDKLKVSLIGDIAHSRVARSNIYCLTKLGADVTVSGPATMLPREVERLGVRVAATIREAVRDADVIMMLRIQKERMGKILFPSVRDYSRFFGLTTDVMREAPPDAIVMHPGPMNRGVEISSEVADGPYSVILDQVTNGVAVRMAILYLLLGRGGGYEDAH
jgi:aspartate carbamoyltransferase catalytic subunit